MRPAVLLFVLAALASAPSLGAPPLGASAHAAADSARAAVPLGFVAMEVAAVVPHDDGNTLLLIDSQAERVLPVGIGDAEALSIHLRLNGEKFDRPLTHDLLDQMVQRLGGRIAKVHIHRVKDGVFHGRVFVTSPSGEIAIDARPSDACALALGNHVPIYVAAPVLTEAGFWAEALLKGSEGPGKRAPQGPSTSPAADGTLAL